MGCAQSKIDNEESVSRCKDRRNFMKEAVTARNAFASGHSGYAVSLKNTGAALSDYAQGEVEEIHHQLGVGGVGDSSEPPLPMMEPFPLPPPPLPSFSPVPPPLPSFSPVPTPPLQRSVTMPAIPVTKGGKKMKKDSIQEEVEGEEEGKEEESGDLRQRRKGRKGAVVEETPSPPPRTPEAPPPPESKGMAWDYFFMVDNMPGPNLGGGDHDIIEEEEEEDEQEEGGSGGDHQDIEPKTPEKVVMQGFTTEEEETPVMVGGMKEKQFMHSNTAPPDIAARRGSNNGGKAVGFNSSMNLLKLLGDIDDHFLKASESAQEVSKMLEATRLHYHSNFADNRGHIDHAARVMRVITWNKSFKGVPNGDGGKDDYDAEEYETHATVLDKLLAWEKKLYEEVKAGELMKLEYQRKVGVLNRLKKRGASSDSLEKAKAAVSHLHTRYIVDMQSLDSTVSEVNHIRDDQLYPKLVSLVDGKVGVLNRLKKRGASSDSLEKAKAAVSHLHTRYIVDMQSLDSTVSEVNHIRDDQLYPKLVSLVDGMSKMWESMCKHHDNQLQIVTDLKSLDVSGTPRETSKHHHERTVQLWHVILGWHSQFEKLVTHQKHYIQALNSWLKLNLVPIESSLKEKISSPPRVQNPPIQSLLLSWHDHLEKLPDELAKSAISSFAAVIKTIIIHQEEEMKLKEKWEETRKEFLRKSQAFEEWYQKYMQRRTPPDEVDPDRVAGTDAKDPMGDRQLVVEILKKRLDDEVEAHQRHCVQVRDKSLGSLKIRLPELFRAMSDYAHVCFDAYESLRSVTQSQNQNGSSR